MDIGDSAYQGDMEVVARHLSPTEAHLLCACLRAGGVPAEAGDTQTVQAHGLLAGALGGACLRVPAHFKASAMAWIAAFQAGDLALPEDFDPGG